MRIIISALLCLFFSNLTYAQWQRLPEPSGGTINDLYSSGDAVYAAEGDYGAGNLYKSTDLGETWQSIGATLPNHPLVLHVAKVGTKIFSGTSQGLYVTTNEGASWKLAVDTSHYYRITTLHPEYEDLTFGIWGMGLFHLSSSGELSQYGLQKPAANEVHQIATVGTAMFAATQGSGIQRSTDGGQNWQAVNTGFVAAEDLYVQSLIAIHDTLIAGTLRGVYRSNDLGEHWTRIGVGPDGAEALLATDTELYANAGALGLYVCKLGDTVWKQMQSVSSTFFELHGLVLQSGKLFIGSQRLGVFRGNIGEDSWTNMSKGITSLSIEGIREVTANGSSALLAGSLDADFGMGWRSTDNGDSWTFLSTLTNRGIHDFVQIGNTVLAGSDGDGIARSTDLGVNWSANIPQLTGAGYVTSLIRTATTVVMVANGFGVGLAYSTDEGNSWNASSSQPTNGGVLSVSYDAASGSTYALTSFGLWRSIDDGKSWSEVNGDAATVDIEGMARAQGRLWAGGRTGLFYSTDDGKTWLKDASNFSSITAMTASQNNVYVAAGSQVYISSISGHWDSAAGLPPQVKVLSMHSNANDVYAGLEGLGLWRMVAPASASVEKPSDDQSEQPKYTSMRDILGRAVAQPISSNSPNLPPGIYFQTTELNGNHHISRVLVTEHQVLQSK